MTAEELKNLIAGGETLTVEFKSDRKGLPDRDLVEAVVALANTEGGVLLLGVEDGTGEITGLHPSHVGKGTPAAMIANRTVPSVQVRVEEVRCDDRLVFVVSVPMIPGVTGTSDGLYLRRRLKPDGTPEAIPMNPFELQSRLSKFRLVDPSERAMDEVPLSAIDPIQRLRIRESIKRNRSSDKALLELDDAAFDRALNLITDFNGREYLTMAGVLFLTSEEVIRRHIPTYEVAFQVLRGTDVRVNDFRRRPIVEEYDALVQRFEAYIDEEEVMRGAYRVAAPNYDVTCFREALTNALVHRDYAQLGTVIVRIDETGVRITNPGGLVAGVSPRNILSVAPRSRNSLLADIAKRIGLAERTGRGVDRIFEGVLRYGRHAPQYTFGDYEVGLFLPNEKADFRFLDFVNELEQNLRRPVSVDLLLVLSRLIQDVTLTLHEILTLTQREQGFVDKELVEWEKMGLIWKDPDAESYSLTQMLNKRLKDSSVYVRQTESERTTNIQRIKSFLAREGTIRRSNVMEICNLTEKQASDMLSKLLESGEIIAEGKGRATTYRLAR